jgi:drug/metabolite transporter (DMT)-like permease
MTAASFPPVPPAATHRLAVANLICMGSMLIWAAGLPAADLIIPLLPAEQLNALRLALAALALLPVWLAIDGWRALRRADWLKGIGVGSFLGLGAWFLVLGQARTDAVTVAVISATLPVVGIGLEILFDHRRLTLPLVAGIALSVVGGLLALDLTGGLGFGIGALFCLGSVIAFALGSRLTVTAFPALSPAGRTAITISGAALVAILIALAGMAAQGPGPGLAGWGWREVAALLAYSVGCLAISQLMWIVSVERLGIGMSSLHINAAPFYVMLILFLFGGSWSWTRAAAAALVGLGVLIAQGIIPLRRR